MVAVVSLCLVSLTLYVYVCCVCVCVFVWCFFYFVCTDRVDRSVGRSVGRPSRPVPSLDEAEVGEG